MARERPRLTLLILFSVVIVDLIGFGAVTTTLPWYAKEFQVDALTLGILVAAWAAAQFVCAPLWGRLSDRIGRRPVMLITIAGTSVALAMLGLADTMWELFATTQIRASFLFRGIVEPTSSQCLDDWWQLKAEGLPEEPLS